jgi:hypothetical protein
MSETKAERGLKKLLTTTATEDRWHLRLGHPGPETLKHLTKAVKGDITATPVTDEVAEIPMTVVRPHHWDEVVVDALKWFH